MSSNDLNDRLDSWKAIAAYLRRTERTARRWERQEGLPVHRLSHHDRSSVYALKSELDAWRAARSHRYAEWRGGHPAQQPAPTPGARPGHPARRRRRGSRRISVVARIGSARRRIPTLAVLPFTIDSADARPSTSAGPWPESLVNQIASAPDLRVRPFASSMRNYREEEEPAAIGTAHGCGHDRCGPSRGAR